MPTFSFDLFIRLSYYYLTMNATPRTASPAFLCAPLAVLPDASPRARRLAELPGLIADAREGREFAPDAETRRHFARADVALSSEWAQLRSLR